MIGVPFNDLRCLGSITDVVAALASEPDAVLAELATKHPTTDSLAEWIRSLPQRDDDGDEEDGPRVESCEPTQRLRIPADDPNCVERAALYIAAAELIDPVPVRQLATLETDIGLHTFPVENGAPVILDPRVHHNCLACSVALAGPDPAVVDTRDAIEWTAKVAEAGAAPVRNGRSRVRRGRNAVMQLVEEGVVPSSAADVDAIGWMFGMAERAARKYGSRVLTLVRTTAQAIIEVLDEVLARQRNLALELGGLRLEAPSWVSQLATVAGRVGLDLGAAALRSKMDSLGIGADMVGLVEQELNREGLTLGVLAHPPKLATFASLQKHT